MTASKATTRKSKRTRRRRRKKMRLLTKKPMRRMRKRTTTKTSLKTMTTMRMRRMRPTPPLSKRRDNNVPKSSLLEVRMLKRSELLDSYPQNNRNPLPSESGTPLAPKLTSIKQRNPPTLAPMASLTPPWSPD